MSEGLCLFLARPAGSSGKALGPGLAWEGLRLPGTGGGGVDGVLQSTGDTEARHRGQDLAALEEISTKGMG